MRHFPLFLDLQGRPVLVAGGGRMATLRVRQLLRAGAHIHVFSIQLESELRALSIAGDIVHSEADLPSEEKPSWALAIGADENAARNMRIHAWAIARGIPVNVVDVPDLCTFIMPAIVDRSPVLVAISTGGASPTLSRLLRERLESLIPEAYGKLALLAESFRDEVKLRLPTIGARQRFWQHLLSGPAKEAILAGDETRGRTILTNTLAAMGLEESQPQGEVWLVGAGPGDPELLTLRALRVLQQADVVVYDRLVTEEIVAYARSGAEKIYAGKRPGDPHMDQDAIHEVLVKHARAGKRVVRLKGGDPFVFGRGGEEREALLSAGIPVHVVPGITAALGCAASAGIPLTHRDHAHQCVFVTGHRSNETFDLDWATLARPRQTLVFYMGMKSLSEICTQLIRHGMNATTPAALIHDGTTPRQRILRRTLDVLPATAREAGMGAPSLLIVGSVVGAASEDFEVMLASGVMRAGGFEDTARSSTISD